MDENNQPQGGVQNTPVGPNSPAPTVQANNPQPVLPPNKSGDKRWMWIALALVGLGLVVAGALYWFVLRSSADEQASSQTNETQNQQVQKPEQPDVPDSTPQTFKSEKLNIELTHRKDWKLKESADGAITITSPSTSYASTDGTSTTGVFTLYLRKGASEAQRTNIDKSIATKDSEVIAYSAPTKDQRQYTNLSFAGPKDMFGFFIVTGNTEFKAGAPLLYALPLDGEFYMIAGGYGNDETGSMLFDPVPKDMFDSPTLQDALTIVKSIKIF